MGSQCRCGTCGACSRESNDGPFGHVVCKTFRADIAWSGHDQEAQIGQVPPRLAQEGSADGPGEKPGHVRHARAGREARTRGAVFQARRNEVVSTARQRAAARKAQAAWRAMSRRAHAGAPGTSHAKPGATGKGAYYYVEVRPKTQFASLSGSWGTLKWRIGKAHAHVERGRLVPD